jgi:hypothetical protein
MIRTSIGATAFAFLLGCTDGASESSGSGASPAQGGEGAVGGAGGTAGGTDASGAGGAMGTPEASWDLSADLTVNGHSFAESIQSAVAFHRVFDGEDQLAVVVTDVPEFCAPSETAGTSRTFGSSSTLPGSNRAATRSATASSVHGPATSQPRAKAQASALTRAPFRSSTSASGKGVGWKQASISTS